MTNRSSLLTLGRGATAVAIVAMLGLAACTPKPATNTPANSAATNGAGLAMITPPPGAPTTPAPGGMTPGGMAPGGMAPGGTNPGGGMAPGGMAPGGMAPGGGGMTPGGDNNGGGMAQNSGAPGGGDAWDQATYSSCVPSAQQNGASQAGAQRYCACVVSALDQLGPRKAQLTPNSPEIFQAANYCRPQAQG